MRHVIVALMVFCLPAMAGDKKGKAKPTDPKDSSQFDDLFGSSPQKGSSLDDMKKATEGMGNAKAGDALAPKVGTIDNDATVKFLNVFAAERIVDDKKLGCQPAGRDKKRITSWTFDEVPARSSSPYMVCLTMQSNAGREMSMNLKVVDGRNQRVNNYQDVVNFRGRTDKIDHVIEFPAPTFKMTGQYFYVVDLDGKEAARLPLFVVKLEGEVSGNPGSTPSDLPPKQDTAPTPPSTPRDDDSPLKAATQQDP